MALFTPEELEELRRADAELDEEFIQTQEEINESRKRDKQSRFERMDNKQKKIAENQRAYREANREKIAENKRAYIEKNRDKWNAYLREYRRRKKAEAAMKGAECHA